MRSNAKCIVLVRDPFPHKDPEWCAQPRRMPGALLCEQHYRLAFEAGRRRVHTRFLASSTFRRLLFLQRGGYSTTLLVDAMLDGYRAELSSAWSRLVADGVEL